MSVGSEQVKELRDRTQAGILDCKEALKETDGDMDAAIEYLEKKGIAAAQSKSGRVASEGLVDDWQADDGREAVLAEINCETDFVARNDDFRELVTSITQAVGESGIDSTDAADEVEVDGEPIPEAIKQAIANIGENINFRRLDRMSVDEGTVGSYIHAGSQIGVLVAVTASDEVDTDEVETLARDVAMHIAAMAPPYVSSEDIPDEDREAKKEVFAAQMEEEGKPEHIIPQIVEGKIEKWESESCLLQQPFVKDSERTVGELQEAIGGVEIREFVRYEVGEGIDEDEDENFAEEVAEMAESARDDES
jgi:elongation factor Ts